MVSQRLSAAFALFAALSVATPVLALPMGLADTNQFGRAQSDVSLVNCQEARQFCIDQPVDRCVADKCRNIGRDWRRACPEAYQASSHSQRGFMADCRAIYDPGSNRQTYNCFKNNYCRVR